MQRRLSDPRGRSVARGNARRHLPDGHVRVRGAVAEDARRRGDLAVLGLPGNPVSAFVTTLLFVKPLVAHLAGAHHPLPTTTRAILGEALPANGPRTDYMRAELRDGRAFVATIQDSSMLLTLARAGCLIVRPPRDPARESGESANILMIG